MRLILILLALALSSSAIIASKPKSQINNTPIDNFDIERYMGKWYEIARFDHFFERNLSNVTAHYKLRGDGKIDVTNRGKKEGEYRSSEAVAYKVKGAPDGALKVKFFLFSSPYMVLDLDKENYSYALVGSANSKYLWILARTPEIPANVMRRLCDEAERRGYNTANFIYVDQGESLANL